MNYKDDIPEALRNKPLSKQTTPRSLILLTGGLLLLLGLGLLAIISFLNSKSRSPEVTSSPTVSPTSSPLEVENILGHLPYAEAPTSDLVAITSDSRIRLRSSAAESFFQMQAAAKKAGIILTPLSGFRSIAEQKHLFFDIKAQRNQETQKRAEVSAPPGYSEHHTGYAIDIGDGNTPSTHLSPSFENTAAFNWLKNYAAQYSFELSFPLNNPQRISYEPWHWRYVGDSDSLETFYKSKQLK